MRSQYQSCQLTCMKLSEEVFVWQLEVFFHRDFLEEKSWVKDDKPSLKWFHILQVRSEAGGGVLKVSNITCVFLTEMQQQIKLRKLSIAIL